MSVTQPGSLPYTGFAQWLKTHHGSVAMAALLALAGPLTFFTGAVSVMREPAAVNVARLAFWWLAYGVVLGCLLLVIGYVLLLRVEAFGRTAGGLLWLLAACLASLATNLVTAGRAAAILEQGLAYSSMTMQLHGFVVSFTMALLYFAHLRRSRENEVAAVRLAAAQAAQRNTRRRIAQTRVQELQARIDPQVLFQMLDTVRRLYESDPGRAEQYLDELVVFLRTALRRVRSTWSSLSREVELACAFVSLHTLAASRAAGFAIDIAADAGSARFPPGVLLPLLDSAIARGDNRLSLGARCESGATCVVLTLDAPLPESALARVRAVLRELHGTSAALEIEDADGLFRTIVRVPHELA